VSPVAPACGAFSGSTSPTNSSGVVTVTYTAGATPGFCTVTATDASPSVGSGTGVTATVLMTQTA
jgi:hypothetical protein